MQHVLDFRKIVREICKASKHTWQKVALRSTSCCCPSACSVSGAWLIPNWGDPHHGCLAAENQPLQLCSSAPVLQPLDVRDSGAGGRAQEHGGGGGGEGDSEGLVCRPCGAAWEVALVFARCLTQLHL